MLKAPAKHKLDGKHAEKRPLWEDKARAGLLEEVGLREKILVQLQTRDLAALRALLATPAAPAYFPLQDLPHPLHWAVLHRDHAAVETILSHMAHAPEIRTILRPLCEGAAYIAAGTNGFSILRLLQEHGLLGPSAFGAALCAAAAGGHSNTFLWLLQQQSGGAGSSSGRSKKHPAPAASSAASSGGMSLQDVKQQILMAAAGPSGFLDWLLGQVHDSSESIAKEPLPFLPLTMTAVHSLLLDPNFSLSRLGALGAGYADMLGLLIEGRLGTGRNGLPQLLSRQAAAEAAAAGKKPVVELGELQETLVRAVLQGYTPSVELLLSAGLDSVLAVRDTAASGFLGWTQSHLDGGMGMGMGLLRGAKEAGQRLWAQSMRLREEVEYMSGFRTGVRKPCSAAAMRKKHSPLATLHHPILSPAEEAASPPAGASSDASATAGISSPSMSKTHQKQEEQQEQLSPGNCFSGLLYDPSLNAGGEEENYPDSDGIDVTVEHTGKSRWIAQCLRNGRKYEKAVRDCHLLFYLTDSILELLRGGNNPRRMRERMEDVEDVWDAGSRMEWDSIAASLHRPSSLAERLARLQGFAHTGVALLHHRPELLQLRDSEGKQCLQLLACGGKCLNVLGGWGAGPVQSAAASASPAAPSSSHAAETGSSDGCSSYFGPDASPATAAQVQRMCAAVLMNKNAAMDGTGIAVGALAGAAAGWRQTTAAFKAMRLFQQGLAHLSDVLWGLPGSLLIRQGKDSDAKGKLLLQRPREDEIAAAEVAAAAAAAAAAAGGVPVDGLPHHDAFGLPWQRGEGKASGRAAAAAAASSAPPSSLSPAPPFPLFAYLPSPYNKAPLPVSLLQREGAVCSPSPSAAGAGGRGAAAGAAAATAAVGTLPATYSLSSSSPPAPGRKSDERWKQREQEQQRLAEEALQQLVFTNEDIVELWRKAAAYGRRRPLLLMYHAGQARAKADAYSCWVDDEGMGQLMPEEDWGGEGGSSEGTGGARAGAGAAAAAAAGTAAAASSSSAGKAEGLGAMLSHCLQLNTAKEGHRSSVSSSSSSSKARKRGGKA